MASVESQLRSLPGSEIVLAGIADLAERRETIAAAAVQTAATRLRNAGIEVPGPEPAGEPGHHLYGRIVAAGDPDPHSRYNAILRRVVSFARALERERAGAR